MANPSSLRDLTGMLKLLTVILGVIALGLQADIYDVYQTSKTEFYLAALIIAFILSFLLLLANVLGFIPQTDMWKKIDMAYHAIMCVFLAIGVILMIVNMVDVADWVPALFKNSAYKKWAAKASFAVIFGGVNMIIYGVISFLLFRGK